MNHQFLFLTLKIQAFFPKFLFAMSDKYQEKTRKVTECETIQYIDNLNIITMMFVFHVLALFSKRAISSFNLKH